MQGSGSPVDIKLVSDTITISILANVRVSYKIKFVAIGNVSNISEQKHIF